MCKTGFWGGWNTGLDGHLGVLWWRGYGDLGSGGAVGYGYLIAESKSGKSEFSSLVKQRVAGIIGHHHSSSKDMSRKLEIRESITRTKAELLP